MNTLSEDELQLAGSSPPIQDRWGWIAVAIGIASLLISGCDKQPNLPHLNAGGSTLIHPLMLKWEAEYKNAKKGDVAYQSIGSGEGILQMTAKTIDIGFSDAPMNDEQLKKCSADGSEPLHIPVIMGAVVPIYNLEGIDEPLRFTGTLLADIYLGKVKKWNDKAIKDLNPDAALPDKSIAVVHRSDGSGTTYIWVDYLNKISADWKKRVGVGTSVNWPTGTGQVGNEGVSKEVSQTSGAIGYVELIFALQNSLKFGWVKNREGEFIEPTMQAVSEAATNSLLIIPEDLRFSITNATGKESYPISGTTWAIVYEKIPADKAQTVKDFLRWLVHEGQEIAVPLHYARLPNGLVWRADEKINRIKTAP
jgi:phosphate transport system substrate-binding protein